MEQQKPEKILYVITKSNFGGAQRYVYDLASGLPRDTYEVAVACGGNGPLVSKLTAEHIPVYHVQNFERDINLLKELRAMRELARIIRTVRPDIIHLNSSKAGGTGALVARLCGVKTIVFTAHGWPFNEPRTALWRCIVWALSYLTTLLSHRVIVVSEYDKTRARMPFLSSRIVLIQTALPPIPFKTREDARLLIPTTFRTRHRDSVWIVSTSEHTRNKNLTMLLRALATLVERGHTGICLTLMSDGEDRPLLERMVDELNIRDYVYFTGFVDEARTYLKAFDIFVLPSLKEGMPYGLLEAGQAELACVASKVGGIPEVMEDGVSGFLINPRNETTLTNAITELITSPTLRVTLGQNLKRKVETDHSLEHMIDETMRVYENLEHVLKPPNPALFAS